MHDKSFEVLYHYLCFLGYVMWMQAQEPCKRTGSFLLIYLRVVFNGFYEAVVCFVGGVMFEHVKDEIFFYCLAHTVKVEWHRFSVPARRTKNFQCLVFWCCCEGKETDVWLPAAFCHCAKNLLLIIRKVMFHCILLSFLFDLRGSKRTFQVSGTFATLRTVCLVNDYRIFSIREHAVFIQQVLWYFILFTKLLYLLDDE